MIVPRDHEVPVAPALWVHQLQLLSSLASNSLVRDDLWLLLTAAGLNELSLEQARAGVERVLAHTPAVDGWRIADLGCGVGRHLFWFDALSQAALIGIDASPVLVDAARRLVPASTVVSSDYSSVGEWGAFHTVCGFAHSLFFADSLEHFTANLRNIRGSLHDFGLLWIEQREVMPGELHWTVGDIKIVQTTTADGDLMRHRFTVPDGGRSVELNTASVVVSPTMMADLAEEAGFVLESHEQVFDEGEWITCYGLRAQKGFNFLSDLSDFLASWAEPGHWRNSVDITWDDPETGRRKPVGEFAVRQGATLSRHHPDFRTAIESGVRCLALELTEGWDFVTYSSCEGHLVQTVPCDVYNDAYCGVVTFANRQITVLEELVKRASDWFDFENVRVRARRSILHGPRTSHTAVDILIERKDPATGWNEYRADAGRAIHALAREMRSIREIGSE